MLVEISRNPIEGHPGFERVRYQLVPPRPWEQPNLNILFGGPQTEETYIEKVK